MLPAVARESPGVSSTAIANGKPIAVNNSAMRRLKNRRRTTTVGTATHIHKMFAA
jgi:hypothetical protein